MRAVVRDDIVSHAEWSADNEPQIHYSQVLVDRYEALWHPGTLPLFTDCSAIWTLFYNWAGAPDPNGRDYNGTGNTASMLAHLDEIPLREAQVADLIMYGPWGGDHVVGIIGDAGSSNPLTVSHGQERGPVRVRHLTEVAAHRGPVRVLRGITDAPPPIPVPIPIPIPKPEDIVKLHFARLSGSPVVYVVSTVSRPRPITLFSDADYWAHIEGNEITEEGGNVTLGPDGKAETRKGILIMPSDQRALDIFGFNEAPFPVPTNE